MVSVAVAEEEKKLHDISRPPKCPHTPRMFCCQTCSMELCKDCLRLYHSDHPYTLAVPKETKLPSLDELKKSLTPSEVYLLLDKALHELGVTEAGAWVAAKRLDRVEREMRECCIDLERHPLTELVGLYQCSHYICRECFCKYIVSVRESGSGILHCVCPVEGCEAKITYDAIREVCGDEVANELDVQCINREMHIYDCPGCSEKFDVTEQKGFRNLTCNKCHVSYCRLCRKPAHPDSCNSRKAMLQEIRAAYIGKHKPMPCPYCMELGVKEDDKCEHVHCEYCKKDFCNLCSAKRSPILVHGNHYHRKSCPHYVAFVGEERSQDIAKCEECQKNKGKLCPRPGDLEDDDIPAAEIPEYLRDAVKVPESK